MPGDIAPEVDEQGFEANLAECSVELQGMVGYLRTCARWAGPDVTQRRYKHPSPNTGWGVSYYVGGNRFCEINPKRASDHTWVFLKGVDAEAVVREEIEPSKQQGWFVLRT